GAGGARGGGGTGDGGGLLLARGLELAERLLQQDSCLRADRVALFGPVDRDQRGAVGIVLDQDFFHRLTLVRLCSRRLDQAIATGGNIAPQCIVRLSLKGFVVGRQRPVQRRKV